MTARADIGDAAPQVRRKRPREKRRVDSHRMTGGELEICVNANGAELTSLRHRTLGECLWNAGPAWPQHAPNLFPIVGQLAGDRLRHAGHTYALTRHGFARRRRFAWLDAGTDACRLELRDDEETRALYPFAFRLEIGYALDGPALTVTYTLRNPGSETLPASIGAHPAFRWPLDDRAAKTAHTLEFAHAEPAPIRRLADGLLKNDAFPTPVDGRVLALDDELFVADAIIMDQIESRSVRYGAPGTPHITVAWDGFRQLGIWSKPGAAFLCIEPWYGYSSPVGFDGEFTAKPGLLHIPPAGETTLKLSVRIAQARPQPS